MDMENKVKQYGSGDKAPDISLETNPTSDAVERFHTNADTDVRSESIHHTLGGNPGQAAPGDHTHDGTNSASLLAGYTIHTGAAIADWRTQVQAALERLGAKIETP